MARINADSEELRAFVARLRDFQQSTQEQLNATSQQLENMAWDDAKYLEYCDSFETVRNAIERSLEALEAQHVPYIERLAASIEEFEGERAPQ